MKNILIVESENDEYFIEALAIKVSLENEVRKIYQYQHSSLDEKKLTITLGTALTDARNRGAAKIGVILDMDNATKTDRIQLINNCIKQSFFDCGYPAPSNLLVNTNQFVKNLMDDESFVEIACFFVNVDGEGELETVLKAIKSQPSIFADCLYDGWLNCLTEKGKKLGKKGEQCDISEKELLKLWVDFYKRFDTLKRQKRNKDNTGWKEIILGKKEPLTTTRGEEIFDLNASELDDIKSFLNMFD